MAEKTTKQVMMIIPGALLLYTLLPIGDYCTGMHTGIAIAFLGLVLLVVLLVITIRDILLLVRKKEKFDFVPVLLFLFFIGAGYWISNLNNKKFWTKEIMAAFYNGPESSDTDLILYANNSFAVSHRYVDGNCTKQGKYRISNDTLYLEHPDLLADKRDSVATRYIIDRRKNALIAVNNKFPQLTIIKSAP